MLIDARHPEETRVAVINGNRIDEFDFESAERQQLKGNIYLAKVTRVEPSLQAAFVDYGGNRHGFLAFSEIHPDYYQIPREDREALLREEAEHAAEEEALRARRAEREAARYSDDEDSDDYNGNDDELNDLDADDSDGAENGLDEDGNPHPSAAGGESEDSAADALRQKRLALRRRYKIQDVIRRRQVLLVQVVKEERGNKGAALTTYLSLAGRYCVLMPNTTHGGGISRKISNQGDRKRLKQIIAELDLPSSMGCIIRTAGLERTSNEIKRDFDYLTRLWDEIRDITLHSSAPSLIHEDSNLIKRAIRDIYTREISDVLVEGEEGFNAAKSFMRLLMPSHARKVQPYVDPVPLFQRFAVEGQLQQMYHPVVQLRSGGYLVINPTEALVSIDINSGRSTREHNIEETALKTNLEAAEEIARQLRLRDMAGLVVIDFIDMESNSNTRKVERAMKEALKNDRARIQVGRISSFGLMEMSRQRLRTGVLEASTHSCPMCEGTGLVRTIQSAALSALRGLEEEAVRGRGSRLLLRSSIEVAIYVLNRKREDIGILEQRYGVHIEVLPDDDIQSSHYVIETAGPQPIRNIDLQTALPALTDTSIHDDDPEVDDDIDDSDEQDAADGDNENERGDRRRRRRRRRRPSRRDGVETNGDDDNADQHASDGDDNGHDSDDDHASDETDAVDSHEQDGDHASAHGEQQAENGVRRRRRRGRRGGRRNREDNNNHEDNGVSAENTADSSSHDHDDATYDSLTAATEPANVANERRSVNDNIIVEQGDTAEPKADATSATAEATVDAAAKAVEAEAPVTVAAVATRAPVRRARATSRKAAAPKTADESVDTSVKADTADATIDADTAATASPSVTEEASTAAEEAKPRKAPVRRRTRVAKPETEATAEAPADDADTAAKSGAAKSDSAVVENDAAPATDEAPAPKAAAKPAPRTRARAAAKTSTASAKSAAEDAVTADTEAAPAEAEEKPAAKAPAKPRTRKAPVRRKKADEAEAATDEAAAASTKTATDAAKSAAEGADVTADTTKAEAAPDAGEAEAPAPKPRARRTTSTTTRRKAPAKAADKAADQTTANSTAVADAANQSATSTDDAASTPTSAAKTAADPAGVSDETAVAENGRPTRRGWWQRTFGE